MYGELYGVYRRLYLRNRGRQHSHSHSLWTLQLPGVHHMRRLHQLYLRLHPFMYLRLYRRMHLVLLYLVLYFQLHRLLHLMPGLHHQFLGEDIGEQ
jgi:hypothetical protein